MTTSAESHRLLRVGIIGNPIAGRGRAVERIEQLEKDLVRRGCRVTTWMGDRPGAAGERAGRIGDEVDRLVVAGGDGSIHEVLNGLSDPGRLPLAVLPVGTANLLARDLHLQGDAQAVARTVVEGRVRRLDMGLIDGSRRFLMVASCGFDATVIRSIHERRRGPLGARGYVLPIVRSLWAYRPPILRVSVDGGSPVRGGLVVVANTPTYAGVLCVAAAARCDSGVLDVVVVRRGSATALARYAWMGWRRRLSTLPDVVTLQGTSVRVEADRGTDVECDGEWYGRAPIRIDLVPRCVPVMVS